MFVVALEVPKVIKTECVPGVKGCSSATQPCATKSPSVPAGSPKTLAGGNTLWTSGVTTSATGTVLPSTVTVAFAAKSSAFSAHVRSSASVVPWFSNVLHSVEYAVTNTFVPGFTKQDWLFAVAMGQTVPPRLTHVNATPPEPNGF